MYMIQRWLSLVLDLTIAALAVVVVGVAIALRDTISPGFTGVSLTQLISLTSYLKLMIMFWVQMETSIGAVSRIRTFQRDTAVEAVAVREIGDWPVHGTIEISNLTARYGSSAGAAGKEALALKDINLSIARCQSIGVCGRTGR